MHSQAANLVLGVLAIGAQAVPQPRSAFPRQAGNATGNSTGPACLPQNDPNPNARAAGVASTAAGYIYGPSLIGEAAPFPNGTLGNARWARDMELWQVDRDNIDNRVMTDAALVLQTLKSSGGLKTMDDYIHLLYDNQWKNTNPLGTTPGIMTNYTQDLLFSMERLSLSPYAIQLVKPTDKLPFSVPGNATAKLAGASLQQLQASGNLFIVDHSYQAHYPKTNMQPARYGGACTAYFFIHPQSGDFLPLAIATNTGSNLVYTPLDSPNDWLLAKMAFNVNDMFHSQMFHLVASHDVSESVHQAALHTLSDRHPILVILDRVMYEGYSSRIVGEQLCFNEGGHWDQLMYVNNTGCRQYVGETWSSAGAFQGMYFQTDLKNRGLIDANGKSKFKSFPFYEDASIIHSAYQSFFQSFVDSYYATDADVAKDNEVQAWFVEATKNAKTQDFPQMGMSGKPVDKATLVDALTHFGFIVSVVHHGLNGGDPIGSKATLPFHTPALFAPLPTEKNVTDLMPFLPPAQTAVQYIGFIGSFNRPFYAAENRTMENAFSNSTMLAQLNSQTNAAAGKFLSSMQGLASQIEARGFDENGLSQGMPFVYRAINPGYIPFFSAV